MQLSSWECKNNEFQQEQIQRKPITTISKMECLQRGIKKSFFLGSKINADKEFLTSKVCLEIHNQFFSLLDKTD